MSNFFADREREQGQSFMENFARESQLELKQLREEKKALERQLEEARELIKDAVTPLGYYSACGGTQATEFLDRNKDLIEQLKEKGE